MCLLLCVCVCVLRGCIIKRILINIYLTNKNGFPRACPAAPSWRPRVSVCASVHMHGRECAAGNCVCGPSRSTAQRHSHSHSKQKAHRQRAIAHRSYVTTKRQPAVRLVALPSSESVVAANNMAARYTHAVVCRIPTSLRNRCDLNVDDAKKEHEAYVRLLRELGLDVIELPPDESLPECVFVEDTAVVCNGIALIARPGAANREKEIETIRVVLKKELDIPVVEIGDPKAQLDGGDVLFTGQEFFVGLSEHTNEAGARAVASAFPEYPCTPIKIPPTKKLKSFITVGGPCLLCVGAGKEAQEVLKRMEREATFSYQTLTLPEDEAANVLYLNGTIVHRSESEIPKSFRVFCDKIDYTRRSLKMSQLAKASCGLSSSCLLVRRLKICRNL